MENAAKPMKAKEFATTYAGRRARVISGDVPRPDVELHPYCNIVGYYTTARYNFVVVEFEDQNDQKYCFNRDDQAHNISFTVKNCGRLLWRLNPENLKIVKNQKPFVLYPHKCGKCHSPARKCGQHVMCSNSHCSAGKRTVREILGTHYTCGTSSNPIYVNCHKCHKPAKMLYGQRQTAECREHGEFRFTYEVNKWYSYLKEGKPRTSYDERFVKRTIRYVGGPRIWWSDRPANSGSGADPNSRW